MACPHLPLFALTPSFLYISPAGFPRPVGGMTARWIPACAGKTDISYRKHWASRRQDGFQPTPRLGSGLKRWKDIGVLPQAVGHFDESTAIQTSRQLAELAYTAIFASINGEIAIIISFLRLEP